MVIMMTLHVYRNTQKNLNVCAEICRLPVIKTASIWIPTTTSEFITSDWQIFEKLKNKKT